MAEYVLYFDFTFEALSFEPSRTNPFFLQICLYQRGFRRFLLGLAFEEKENKTKEKLESITPIRKVSATVGLI